MSMTQVFDSYLADAATNFILPFEARYIAYRTGQHCLRIKNLRKATFLNGRLYASGVRRQLQRDKDARFTITLTRIMLSRQRNLKERTLPMAFETIRQGIADALDAGFDDARLEWRYIQKRENGKWCGVRVAIAPATKEN